MTDVRAAGVQVDVAYVPPPPEMRVSGVQVDVAYVYGGPAGPTVTIWNGTSEIATTLKVWNGTTEIDASVSSVT